MSMITYLLISIATFACYVESTSNNTLQLPLTINPLLQDSIQQGGLVISLTQVDPVFFKHVTFSDIVKNLSLPSVPQLKKGVHALVILGLAAKLHGLTLDKLEFLNTTSKWTITMTIEDLANVSENTTLPLTDEVLLITIQEAMFTILEKRFNFEIEEVAERLNATIDEVYGFIEPGWIQVVNFITEKNVLALSRNYTIPPFYIAKALNMSLPELYNSTLPQLEDILVNKTDVIKEAVERYRRSVSIAGLVEPVSSTLSTVVATISSINSTAVPVMMENTTTMAIQPSFTMHTETKTPNNLNEISSHQTMNYTLSIGFNGTLKSSTISALQTSSMEDSTRSFIHTMRIYTTISSSTNVKSTSVTNMEKLTPSETQSISMYHTPVSMTITGLPHGESSAALNTSIKSQPVINQESTKQQTSMFQPTTTTFIPPTTSTELLSTTTGTSQTTSSSTISTPILSKSSIMLEMISVASQSSPDLVLKASSKMMNISSTQHMLPTVTTHDESSSMFPTSSYTMDVSSSKDLSKSMVNTMQTSSLGKTISSYHMSETENIDAMKSSSVMEMTSTIKTSFVMTTSSHPKNTQTPKLYTTSQVTKTTKFLSEGMKSSHFPRNAQTSSSGVLSSHFVVDMKTSTKGHLTRSRHQQITSSIESSSPGFTSTADDLVLKTTMVAVKPSLTHAITPSSSHVAVAATSSTAIIVGNTVDSRSEDEMDPVILIILPIMGVLLLAAFVVALVMWMRHRRRRMSGNNNNAERGSELSSKGLVESLENINNARTTGFVNKGGDSSRSMSRTSSMSNLETIHEGNEPETPEVYKLEETTSI